MGLLSKASEFHPADSLAFYDFIITNKIKKIAVFQLTNNFYKIINSYGFDGASLLSSESSLDFWNGICSDYNKIYNFTCYNKSLNPILQFFSFSMKDEINTVSLYRTGDFIFMLCNKEFTTENVQLLQNIKYSETNISLEKINEKITPNSLLYEYEIDFEESINDFLISKNINSENLIQSSKLLFNELLNEFALKYSPYSTKKISKNCIRVLINAYNNISEEQIISHLIYNLKKILGNSAEIISFNKIGIAESVVEIKNFFQVD